jgi:hypothetical protein
MSTIQTINSSDQIVPDSLDKINENFEALNDDKVENDLTVLDEKTDPVDADILLLADSEDSFALKKVTKENLLAGLGGGGSSIWTAVPGTPTRVSDTQFTITDTGNAGLYDQVLSKGTVLKWSESGTVYMGMVVSASYGTDTVTVNIIGDTLTAGFTDMKYFIATKALTYTFAIAGTMATGTDLSSTFYAPYDIKVFGADARVKTAGTTNPTTFDINDDGTTMFTTKPSIASTNTSDLDNTADDNIVAAEDSAITIDVDAVSTTQPVDAYVTLFFFPNKLKYIS